MGPPPAESPRAPACRCTKSAEALPCFLVVVFGWFWGVSCSDLHRAVAFLQLWWDGQVSFLFFILDLGLDFGGVPPHLFSFSSAVHALCDRLQVQACALLGACAVNMLTVLTAWYPPCMLGTPIHAHRCVIYMESMMTLATLRPAGYRRAEGGVHDAGEGGQNRVRGQRLVTARHGL